ncbi:MAG TPA: hypothetical protein VJZ25_08240, partial [Gemmatimonadaceae bacterium]|nr:hypothetical protein [Gemmatimonadaceae bacterium]
MARRIFAIAFIFVCASVAWVILGSNIFMRTQGSDRNLRTRVGSTWGTNQAQRAPVAFTEKIETRTFDASDRIPPIGRDRSRQRGITTPMVAPAAAGNRSETVRTRVPLALDQTRAAVDFDLDHRRKGLLWYSTYAVKFDGNFRFRNTTASDSVVIEFPLPAAQASYDDLRVSLDGTPVPYRIQDQALLVTTRVPTGDSVGFSVSYSSRGLSDWRYVFANDVAEVRDLEMVMRTDFDDIDFPENTLSPTEKIEEANCWRLKWRYTNLLSGFQIGMDMPEKL